LPRQDQAGRSSIETVYLAGDGASIRGADAAERAGQRVALAVLEDMDIAVDSSHAQRLEHEIARMDGFRQSLDKAFSFPIDWAAETPDEVIVCRCEEISVGELRAVVRHGATEMNRAKALCRVGMGRCQGRMCSAAAMEIIATESGRPIETVGRIRAQAPIKPLPFNVEAEQ
jgi:NADPH-dependent 2,4-dienoyl-CoA reductase/sulfur reductase-like enzyme